MSQVIPLRCANSSSDSEPSCSSEAKFACASCHLVAYCGRDCQRAHWSEHKETCKSPLGKKNWRPDWDREQRLPPWANPAISDAVHNPFGEGKYLWGNTPAIDVLQLQRNEGEDYQGHVNLLFAASGDLRNVVKTIALCPESLKQPVEVMINDKEFAVVAHNIIWLLYALSMAEGSAPAVPDLPDRLIHLWYSAFLPADLHSQLHDVVKPLIADVCRKVASKAPSSRCAKTFRFNKDRTSVRLTLKQEEWLGLERLFEVDMSLKEARQARNGVLLAPARHDYRDRWYFLDTEPSMRVAKRQFRADGVLLPFGNSRAAFVAPNFTLFSDARTWQMNDKTDPMDGWLLFDVHNVPWTPKFDLYGRLYSYLRNMFDKFLGRLKIFEVSIEVHCADAIELPQLMKQRSFMRIEVSNITDAGYLGLDKVLTLFTPLLQLSSENRQATLITSFLNAVVGKSTMVDGEDVMGNTNLLMKYLPAPDVFKMMAWPDGAETSRLWDARGMVMDKEKCFEQYRRILRFDACAAVSGSLEKRENTIVEKWPTHVQLEPEQHDTRQRFNMMLGSNHTGRERFVEWTRIAN